MTDIEQAQALFDRLATAKGWTSGGLLLFLIAPDHEWANQDPKGRWLASVGKMNPGRLAGPLVETTITSSTELGQLNVGVGETPLQAVQVLARKYLVEDRHRRDRDRQALDESEALVSTMEAELAETKA